MNDEEQQSEEYNFSGAFLKNEEKITAKKSIVICGITRGGTSFAASVFGQLGIPFSRKSERDIGRRYEHRGLRDAFQNRDADALKKLATSFSEEYPVWAWKLPAIQRRLEFAAENVPNPHFVIIFKEPLSVAARKTDRKGKETLDSLRQVLTVYQHLAEMADGMEYPLLLISYDRAMAKLPAFLAEVAQFAGVTSFDVDRVIDGIRDDGERYFQVPGKKNKDAPAEDKPARLRSRRRRKGAEPEAKPGKRERAGKRERSGRREKAGQARSKPPKEFALL